MRLLSRLAALGVGLAVPIGSTALMGIDLPRHAQAAPTEASGAPDVATGFAPVADLDLTATSLASPSDGQVYVAGVDAGGRARATLWIGGSPAVVDVDAPGPATVRSAAGQTLLLTGRGRMTRLWQLRGATATALDLPALADDERITGMAVDHTGLHLTLARGGVLDGSLPYLGVARWNGIVWTTSYTPFDGERASDFEAPVYALDGTVVTFTRTQHRVTGWAWDGSSWSDIPSPGIEYRGFVDHTWLLTGTDLPSAVAWGYAYDIGRAGAKQVTTPLGTCHQLGTNTACAAPRWPVSAATRLPGGQVVLGASDREGSMAPDEPGTFAVVPTPGAMPVDIPGDNGDRVVELAAEPTSGAVWALTRTVAGDTLRRMAAVDPTAAPTTSPIAGPPGRRVRP